MVAESAVTRELAPNALPRCGDSHWTGTMEFACIASAAPSAEVVV